ncbi:MAG: hypothetical protein QOJ35_2950 [Solirubrobacteraceae bacterium]|jgi:hypothetical protein|nr:hypothetical protein [Solirubrobacteraceae bacterium]
MAFYVAITSAILLCAVLSHALPSFTRVSMVVAVTLMGATAFAPGLAPGGRVLAVVCTVIVAVACAQQLRTGSPKLSFRANA